LKENSVPKASEENCRNSDLLSAGHVQLPNLALRKKHKEQIGSHVPGCCSGDEHSGVQTVTRRQSIPDSTSRGAGKYLREYRYCIEDYCRHQDRPGSNIHDAEPLDLGKDS